MNHTVFYYLTVLSFILIIFWKWTHLYIDLPILALIVAFNSFPIIHIHPRRIENPYTHEILEGKLLIAGDILFHWLPLLFVVSNRTIMDKCSYEKITYTLLAFMYYAGIVDAFCLYDFHDRGVCFIFLLLAITVRIVLC